MIDDDIVIRKADLEADRKRVEKCVRACGKYNRSYFDMYYPHKYYEKGQVWLAERPEDGPDGPVLGFAVAVPLVRTEVTSLYEIGVVPDMRGRGLAREILEHARVGRPLRFVVDEGNEGALAFYRRLGMVPTTPTAEPAKPGSKNIVWRFEGEPLI